MKKTNIVLIVILLLILENAILWYASSFSFQSKAQKVRTESKAGQAEVCKNIPLSSTFSSVLEKMDNYNSDLTYVDSMGRINLSYGSEMEGYVSAAGVGFVFDENYKLIEKTCEGSRESITQ